MYTVLDLACRLVSLTVTLIARRGRRGGHVGVQSFHAVDDNIRLQYGTVAREAQFNPYFAHIFES